MAKERQQGTWTQLKLFEVEEGSVRHGVEPRTSLDHQLRYAASQS